MEKENGASKTSKPQPGPDSDRLVPLHIDLELGPLGSIGGTSQTELGSKRNGQTVSVLGKRVALDDDTLAEDNASVQYQLSGIESFGEKMIKMMDQQAKQGEGVPDRGRPDNPVQFMPRPENMGLGAIPKKVILEKIKRGEQITDKDLRSRAFKNVGKVGEDPEASLFKYGDQVIIQEGKYKDMRGLVMEFNKEEDRVITIQLALNGKNVRVLTAQVRKAQPSEPLKNTAESSSKTQLVSHLEKEPQAGQPKEKKKRRLKWVLPDIVVRIVSKSYREGKYFEELATVIDILDGYSFSLQTVGGDLLEDLVEKQIETVMPSLGQKVLVLKGEFKGQTGVLVERKKKENLVLVRLEIGDAPQVEKMSQDDCCKIKI